MDLNQQQGEIAKVGADNMTIYSMNLERELIPPELEPRWILLENHPYLPYIKFSQTDKKDPVASDIQSIPQVLNEIKNAFLGVPDGRRNSKQQEEENAVIMTGKQANGVRNINVGPEIVVMGHNPEISQKGFSNAIILGSNNLQYQYWKSQSRTKIMTTAAPVAGLDKSTLANNHLNQLCRG